MFDTTAPDTSAALSPPPLPTGPVASEPSKPASPKGKRKKKTRRASGEGSVYERDSDGRWCATWKVKLPSGKTKTRVVYGASRTEAIAKRDAAKREAETVAQNATKETTGDFLRRWLDTVKSKLRPTSLASYSEQVRLYMAPEKDVGMGLGIGPIPLSRLSPLDIEAWLASLEKRGVSASRRHSLCVQLKSALGRAVAWRQLKENPMSGVEYPTVKREQMKVWDSGAVSAFLRACEGERLEALFVLAIETGMRQGELLGLQWADVETKVETDPTTGTARYSGRVHVRHNLQEVNGNHQPLAEPKTAAGYRTITLMPDTVRALVRHRERMMAEGKAAHPYVFPSTTGRPIFKRALRDAFNRLIKTAGVRQIRFHDLRHTNATLLIARGVPSKTVASRLGHSSIVITLNTYAKFMPEADQQAAEVMASIMGRKTA
ncbi:site-specific integrase [Archangium sp. Cb G35]|uniref:tyrosine-type recombinase/integrase n=1 Tax=Archangium sp. Cb G35 TaxID=1920190 RepID=UPI0009F989F6|nr:site-specific integrase [Archangium sp. Cb G35]